MDKINISSIKDSLYNKINMRMIIIMGKIKIRILLISIERFNRQSKTQRIL